MKISALEFIAAFVLVVDNVSATMIEEMFGNAKCGSGEIVQGVHQLSLRSAKSAIVCAAYCARVRECVASAHDGSTCQLFSTYQCITSVTGAKHVYKKKVIISL